MTATVRTPEKPFTPTQERILDLVVKPMSRINIWLYRLTGGRVGGRFPSGAPILLLTVKGRKSGVPRTTPLLYLRDGDRVVIVASKAGSAKNPLWFENLRADPSCEVEIGRDRRRMQAHEATPDEKARYWPQLVAMYPDYDDYQRRTARDIPVVVLEPA
jgi:deazaflavin-dependent oxidoreductase (nitroreductase family)